MFRRNPIHLAARMPRILAVVGVEVPLMGQVCTGMCDHCWIGTDRENNCDPAWNGARDGCDCGCQCLDPGRGPCPDGVCDPDENPRTCPQDCPGCHPDADCDNGRYCNGVEGRDGSSQCLAAGEADCDGDSDLVDCSTLHACFGGSASGRGSGPIPTWCKDVFDRDGNGDVDLDDYVIFQGHIAGPAR